MIRSFLRSLAQIVMAALLLALSVCAVEVGLRGWRVKQRLKGGDLDPRTAWTMPSSSSWIDVIPLQDREWVPDDDVPVRVVTNQQGLRCAEPVVVPKPSGLIRVLCLGSDTVFGSELTEESTLPSRLQAHLTTVSGQQFEVVNAGCPRTGPLIQLMRFRNHLCALQPDVVLLCVTPEDLQFDEPVRGHVRIDTSGRPAFAPHPSIGLAGNQVVDQLIREFALVNWIVSRAGQAAGMDSSGNRLQNDDHENRSTLSALAAVAPLAELVSANRGELVISIAPSLWSQSDSPHADISSGDALQRDLFRLLQQLQLANRIPVDNSLAAFHQFGSNLELYSASSGCLSPRGTDLYARRLTQFLSTTVAAIRVSRPDVPAAEIEPIPPIATSPQEHGRRPRSEMPAGRF